MKTIGVTMEVTHRLYKEFEITDEAFVNLLNNWQLDDAIGVDAYLDFREETDRDGSYESDYAISDENGNTLIDWL